MHLKSVNPSKPRSPSQAVVHFTQMIPTYKKPLTLKKAESLAHTPSHTHIKHINARSRSLYISVWFPCVGRYVVRVAGFGTDSRGRSGATNPSTPTFTRCNQSSICQMGNSCRFGSSGDLRPCSARWRASRGPRTGRGPGPHRWPGCTTFCSWGTEVLTSGWAR